MQEKSDNSLSSWLLEHKILPGKVDLFKVPLSLLCENAFDVKGLGTDSTKESIDSSVIRPNLSAFRCRICQEVFESHQLQQQHFKSLSHVSNLRATLSDADRSLVTVDESEQYSTESSSDDDVDDDTVYTSVTRESESVEEVDEASSTQTADTLYEQGSVRKQNSKHAGLQIIFHRKNSDVEYGISTAILDMATQGSNGHQEEQTTNPWVMLSMSLYHLQSNPYTCLICLQSGRFAGAVFCGMDVVVHKTFRRYTVRAKAGGAQSNHDKAGRKANSIGAQLRRYGEQALREDVHKVLCEWRRLLHVCSVVLVAVPKAMRGRYIYNIDNRDFPLTKSDSRIRDVPFSIPKPTLEEVIIAHGKCMSVTFSTLDMGEGVSDCMSDSIPAVCLQHSELSTLIEEEEEGEREGGDTPVCHDKGQSDAIGEGNKEEDVMLLPMSLQTYLEEVASACEVGDISAFHKALEGLQTAIATQRNNGIDTDHSHLENQCGVLSVSEVLCCPVSVTSMCTVLHLAAATGHVKMITTLLQLGASPSIKDVRGRYPYFLARDKDSRDAFRR